MFIDRSAHRSAGSVLPEDVPYRRMLHYLFFASRGGSMRWRVVESVAAAPRNMNQLAEDLKVNYKTVQHHVRILKENDVLVASKAGSYGAVYFLTSRMESNLAVFREIWKGMGGK